LGGSLRGGGNVSTAQWNFAAHGEEIELVKVDIRVNSALIVEPGPIPFQAIDHVQLAMPPGGENAARAFYAEILGMTEIPKPVELVGRGGCWFRSGAVEIHLGVQADFRAATKAHPALRCTNFDALTAKLRQAGVEAVEALDIPGVRRCHIADPFGNRIELLARVYQPRSENMLRSRY
jgi:catechol 2,3-dioxygenase-like lactoylglutathione lyase family enzyme